MPDYNIPMSAARASIGSGAETPLQADTRLPMAVTPFTPIDPVADTAQAYKLADSIETFKEKQSENLELQRVRQEKQHDKDVLNQYLSGGGDLYSPEGLKKAQEDLKGKLSSTSYMNLGDTLDKRRTMETKMKQNLLTMDDDAFERSLKRQAEEMQNISGVISAYETGMKTGGEKVAQQEFDKAKKETIARLAAQKTESGEPAHNPKELQRYEGMAYDALKHALQNSAWGLKVSKQASGERKNEASTRHYQALADKEESEVGVAAKRVQAIAEKAAKSSAPLSDEDLATVAEQVRVNGIPTISRFGFSPEQKQQIVHKVTQLNNSENVSAREAAVEVGSLKSDQKSLDKLVPQLDAITAFEKTASQIGDKLKTIAKKVDSTGVPVFERWIRAGRKAVEGDPDVTEFGSRLLTYTSETARILNNPNLTGPTTDSARHETQEVMPSASTYEQIERGVDIMKEESGWRKKNLKDQIDEVNQRRTKGASKEETSVDKKYKQVGKYKTPEEVKADYKAGAINKEEAKTVLKEMGFNGG